MKKLSEYENEKALELLGDLLVPSQKILSDPEIANTYRTSGDKMKLIQMALKQHSKEIIEILAILEGVPVEKYKANIVTMTKDLIELLNDEALVDFFTSQEQPTAKESFGVVTENTEDGEK